MQNQLPQIYFEKVKTYFNGDVNRTWTWFKSLNPNLGMSPLEMMKIGRTNKLKQFIDNHMAGNIP